MFVCRICGSKEYEPTIREWYYCTGCGVMFTDPNLFSDKEKAEEIEVQQSVLRLLKLENEDEQMREREVQKGPAE